MEVIESGTRIDRVEVHHHRRWKLAAGGARWAGKKGTPPTAAPAWPRMDDNTEDGGVGGNDSGIDGR